MCRRLDAELAPKLRDVSLFWGVGHGCRNLFDLVAGTAAIHRSLKRRGGRQRGRYKLNLLAPFQAEPFVNAGITIRAVLTLHQEIIDPLWYVARTH